MRLRRFRWAMAGTAVACVAGLAACGPTDDSGAGARAPVTFTATEYAYDGPESISGGLTEIELVNAGEQAHALLFMGFPADKTLDDVAAAVGAATDGSAGIPEWLTFPGGIGGIAPGGRASAVLDLAPGQYALLSFETAPGEQTPDVAKGMLRALAVTEAETVATAPAADVTLDLADYSFEMSGTLAAGEQTIKVVNQGPQLHEAIVMRLADGVTAADFVEAMSQQPPPSGPPPVTAAGGMGPLSLGASGFVTLDLEPGRYMFICFVPDAADGAPHAVKGMVKEITVQ
ncbi:hypothetical protein DCC79_03490 [bacterium]|nr:hypothetical protein [Chloroflexi bacterium CFX6]RIL11849.1 MAG: hypothetical protein DCC79_03490 [bacterium]